MYYCCAITDKGIRSHNEDALLIHRTVLTEGVTEQELSKPFLIAVADGVAGEQSGEIASSKCLEMLKQISFSSRVNMEQKLSNIHTSLAKIGAKQKHTRNMQTTLCAIGVDEHDMLYSMNVGDSRLYRYRNQELLQLSRDQSLVQLLLEAGAITPEQQQNHIYRNIIFPVLGNMDSKPEFDIKNYGEKIKYGDILLLCSDGLSDYVSKSEMERILMLNCPMVRRLQLLTELSMKHNCTDNITIIALTRLKHTRR
ncbi:MAG: protein phosphatase 2C domain-containing protein [Oscillospiraceae bacterium]|nr:protein phosphatase 2C domain-containing protein [Oscillospiraceae bacterium]